MNCKRCSGDGYHLCSKGFKATTREDHALVVCDDCGGTGIKNNRRSTLCLLGLHSFVATPLRYFILNDMIPHCRRCGVLWGRRDILD